MPRGFDERTAVAEIAVFGNASADLDFTGDGDRVRYRVAAAGATSIRVELRYQPIGFRWAQNLTPYKAIEPQRFLRYYNALGSDSSVVVSQASSPVRP